ncbi:hypothetical protein DMC30DRAFT_392821 [Rhodotorula diobovata]|uniref:Uncharacterized protein n=1 Tax=Rhodotorula diobovata TaxID=5288 RepID=A0A5C5FZ68_9BASI|nr:hypothetical protein DMC30DRAFT_392821 [Rhodotorula diobovata]
MLAGSLLPAAVCASCPACGWRETCRHWQAQCWPQLKYELGRRPAQMSSYANMLAWCTALHLYSQADPSQAYRQRMPGSWIRWMPVCLLGSVFSGSLLL